MLIFGERKRSYVSRRLATSSALLGIDDIWLTSNDRTAYGHVPTHTYKLYIHIYIVHTQLYIIKLL